MSEDTEKPEEQVDAEVEAEAEAEAIRVKAKAQAEALGLIEEVISTNPDLITYEYVQQLSPNIRVMLLPNDTPLILPAPDLESATGLEAIEVAEKDGAEATVPTRPTETDSE